MQVDPPVTLEAIHKATSAAMDAGCDDPLIGYLHNRSLTGRDSPGTAAMIRCTKALAASRYPVFRRAIALQMAGSYALTKEARDDANPKQAERDFDETLALLPRSVAEDERNEFWEDRWLEHLDELVVGYRAIGMDGKAAYERVDAALAKIPELKVLRLLFRGIFWESYGWESRTTAFAQNVPPEGAARFVEYLEIGRKALEEAWVIRPGDARTANYLLSIEKGIGGDRANMERWFDRTMKADGDKYSACLTKLDWLDPKWYGTADEMLASGRACRATNNWFAGITLLVGDAHLRYIGRLEPAKRTAHMKSPEAWDDIKSVYDEYLKHHPENHTARSKYAVLCYLGAHFAEAHVQFQALGDNLTRWTTFPYYPLETMQQFREHAARLVTGAPLGQGLGGWVRINARNSERAWTAEIPAKPERGQEPGILGATFRNFSTCTVENVTYAIKIQLIPEAARANGPKALLSAARDALANESGGRVLDAHKTTIGGGPPKST